MSKREWFYPTAFSYWDDEEYAAIKRVILSGRYTMGGEVRALEREFADYHGMKHGIMTNSGSSANLIAVAALFHKHDNPLRRGDRVTVPALAWSTTYAPLIQYGLDPILEDIDDTWNVRTDKGGFNCHLVVGVSMLGNPANLPELLKQSKAMGRYLIEDCCESVGAKIDGKLVGTFGLMSTFSFFFSHQISAVEGGMVLTNDDELADLCRMLRAHGWTRDTAIAPDFDHEYDFRLFGYNVRGTEIYAAIAREQLKKLPIMRAARHRNLTLFEHLTEGLPIEHPAPLRRNASRNPFSIPFLCSDLVTKCKLVDAFRSEGIDCRSVSGGSFTRHIYGMEAKERATEIRTALALPPWHTPKADRVHDCGLMLGNAGFDLSDKIERAVSVMQKVLQ